MHPFHQAPTGRLPALPSRLRRLPPGRRRQHRAHHAQAQHGGEGEQESAALQVVRIPRHHHRPHDSQSRQHVICPARHFPEHPDQVHPDGPAGGHAESRHAAIQKQQHAASHSRRADGQANPAQQPVDSHADDGDVQRGDGQDVQDAVPLVQILQLAVQVLLVPQKQSAHHSRLLPRENPVQPLLQQTFQFIQAVAHRPPILPAGLHLCLPQLPAD